MANVTAAFQENKTHAVVIGDVRYDLHFVAACGMLLDKMEWLRPDAPETEIDCEECSTNIEKAVRYNEG